MMALDDKHNELLSGISDDYEKVPGSFIYILTRPTAKQLVDIDNKIETINTKLNIENLNGMELATRVNDRTGLTKKLATYSIGILQALGNGTININDLFETNAGIQFVSIETVTIIGSGFVKVRCTQAGTIGNVPANQIVHIPITINGITAVTNLEPTKDGFEEESDDDLLARYYERIRTPATSGNKAHYINWAKEVTGVGEARCFPLWNGDNTVKVVIIDANRQPASIDIVEDVQEYIDPNITGLGDGVAPLGAFCTVVSARGKSITLSFVAVKDAGFSDDEIIQNVSANMIQYLKSIAFKEAYVSYAQIGSIILMSEGIKDYSDLLVNGDNGNIELQVDEVAILGGVTIV